MTVVDTLILESVGQASAVLPKLTLNAIKLVIFDCDGVLINSEPIASRTLAEALRFAGVEISASQAHIRFTGNSETDIRRICAEEFGLGDVDEMFEAWHKRLFAEFATSLEAMPGMGDVVRSISVPKCVASNSPSDRLQNSLGHLDLWREFAPDVFGADAVARPKPAPDLLLLCARNAGIDPAWCVMIDDSPHGITSAIHAGMVAIGFVDPSDPRPNRGELLKRAGALVVATGAAELGDALRAADSLLAS